MNMSLNNISLVISLFTCSTSFLLLPNYFLLKNSWLAVLCQFLLYKVTHLLYTNVSQDVEWSSVCCTVGPCCLFTLNVAISSPKLPVHSSPSLQAARNYTCSPRVTLILFWRQVCLYRIWIPHLSVTI